MTYGFPLIQGVVLSRQIDDSLSVNLFLEYEP